MCVYMSLWLLHVLFMFLNVTHLLKACKFNTYHISLNRHLGVYFLCDSVDLAFK